MICPSNFKKNPYRDLEFNILFSIWQSVGDGHRGRGSRKKSFSVNTVLVRLHRLLFGAAGFFCQDSVDKIIELTKGVMYKYQDYVKVTGDVDEYFFVDRNSQKQLKTRVYQDLIKLYGKLKEKREEK